MFGQGFKDLWHNDYIRYMIYDILNNMICYITYIAYIHIIVYDMSCNAIDVPPVSIRRISCTRFVSGSGCPKKYIFGRSWRKICKGLGPKRHKSSIVVQ